MRFLPALFLPLFYSIAVTSLAFTTPPTTLLNPINLNPTNLTLPLSLSDTYRVNCVKITDPPQIGLNPTNCEIATPIICQRLNFQPPTRLVRDKWIWTELPGCALGYYLPEAAPLGSIPTAPVCEGSIFGGEEGIVDNCGTDSRFNAGSVNVGVMPDFGDDGTAVDGARIRYVLAPERLTLYGGR